MQRSSLLHKIGKLMFSCYSTELCSKRLISASICAPTRFDPARWAEPIVTIEELNKPLPPDDEHNFKYIKPMKTDQTPVFYRSPLLDRMMRICLKEGRKELVREIIFDALEIVKRRQYTKYLDEPDEAKKAQILLDPIEICNRAMMNCRPVMKLKKMIKAGTVYQVPFPTSEHESIFMAIKMMRDICRQKAGKKRTEKRPNYPHFKDVLAYELLAALENEGMTIHAKQELHKLCEQNRGYTNYRRY